jgi:hypothetical protein
MHPIAKLYSMSLLASQSVTHAQLLHCVTDCCVYIYNTVQAYLKWLQETPEGKRMGGAVLALNLKLKAAAASGGTTAGGASPTATSSAGGTSAADAGSSNRKASTQGDGSSASDSGNGSTALPGDIDPPDLDAMGPMATVWSEVDTQQFIDITEESIVPVVSLDTEPAGRC